MNDGLSMHARALRPFLSISKNLSNCGAIRCATRVAFARTMSGTCRNPASAPAWLMTISTDPANQQRSLLLQSDREGRQEAIATLQMAMARLLTSLPPGRVRFTIIDPVGLGQSFAGVMHLSDYGEHLLNSRIWTQSSQIEEKLAALNEHMEKVIQMYLRNEYATIARGGRARDLDFF